MSFLALVGLGVAVFASTNIDDVFVLMLFFSDRDFSPLQVVLGQYLGIGLLVGISVIGALVALVIPASYIGLMGLLPILIGLKKLLDLRKKPVSGAVQESKAQKQQLRPRVPLRFLAVTAVTVANGGDNIGVYIPLFATSTLTQIVTLILIFSGMVAVWCGLSYYLIKHTFVGDYMQRWAHRLLPFVLITLGLYILSDVF